MKKTIKWLFLSLVLGCIGVVTLTLGCLLVSPQLLVNNKTFPHIVKYLKQINIDITYEEIDVAVSSDSLLNKQLDLAGKNVCITYKPTVASCFQSFQSTVKINLIGSPVILTQIGPIAAKQGQIKITTESNDEPKTDEPFEFHEFMSMIQHTKIKPISLEAIEFILINPKGKPAKSDLNFNIAQIDATTMDIGLLLEGKENFPLKRLYLKGIVSEWDNHRIPNLEVAINADTNTQLKTTSTLSLKNSGKGKSSIKSSTNILLKKTSASIDIDGYIADETLKVSIVLDAKNLSGGIKRIKSESCLVDVSAFHDYTDFAVGISSCELSLNRGLFENEGKSPIEFPTKLSLELNAAINFNIEKHLTFTESKGRIDINPLINDLYKVAGGFDFAISGDFGPETKPDFILNIDSTIELHRFQKLVEKLANSNYSIPAPLNSLEGHSRCELKGRINLTAGTVKIPHSCMINLKGQEQALDLSETGMVQIVIMEEGISPQIDAEIVLNNIEMFLPDFKITDPVPKMTPDQRFVKSGIDEYLQQEKEQKQKKETALAFNIALKTNKNPVRLHTPTLKTIVPLHLNLLLSSNHRPDGSIKIAAFEVKILKKDLHIDRVNLQFNKQKPNTIDAKATIERSEFDLILAVFGNLNKPKVDISSDPVQTDSEMMSSLLYGGSYNDLNSSQQKSVAETRAAFTDGAIGLISMFYLAATPVESVGYNPHTQQFRADVKLGSGASLQVGSNLEGQSELGIRKRLRGNWFFETYAISEEASDGTKGVAMLKWANRY